MPHIHELYDFVVTVFIVHDNRVLLVNHPRYGLWLGAGGHIELDEDPEEAVLREAKEETGLDIELLGTRPDIPNKPGQKFLIAPDLLEVHNAGGTHKHIALTYYARSKNSKHVKSAEHTDIKWFTEAELSDKTYDIHRAVKFNALAALEKASHASA